MRQRLPYLISFVLLIVSLVPSVLESSVGQTHKQSTNKKRTPKPPKPFESRCGVRWNSVDEFMEERQIEWRVAAASNDAIYYYNTHKILCDDEGVLRVWTKEVKDGETHDASISRNEFKCRTNQMRTVSRTEYKKDGSVSESWANDKVRWSEVIPDSIGERMLEHVCRKDI